MTSLGIEPPDIPACSIVPQPITVPRAQVSSMITIMLVSVSVTDVKLWLKTSKSIPFRKSVT
jgi:hypothetical protein